MNETKCSACEKKLKSDDLCGGSIPFTQKGKIVCRECAMSYNYLLTCGWNDKDD